MDHNREYRPPSREENNRDSMFYVHRERSSPRANYIANLSKPTLSRKESRGSPPQRNHLDYPTKNYSTSSAQSHRSQSTHTPPPMPQREPLDLPTILEVGEVNSASRERRHVLERISAPIRSENQRTSEGSSLLSGHLQEVEVLFEEEENQNTIIRSGSRLISSQVYVPQVCTLASSPLPE